MYETVRTPLPLSKSWSQEKAILGARMYLEMLLDALLGQVWKFLHALSRCLPLSLLLFVTLFLFETTCIDSDFFLSLPFVFTFPLLCSPLFFCSFLFLPRFLALDFHSSNFLSAGRFCCNLCARTPPATLQEHFGEVSVLDDKKMMSPIVMIHWWRRPN